MTAITPLLLNVDDDDVARYARGRLLRRAGFDVRDAATGRAALDLVADHPDLVVLDVGLPDMSGFDVCRRIKADRSLGFIPVLQVSATFVKGTDRARALDGGADGYLIEPVEPEVLVATVNAMLRARRAENELAASARHWQATFDAISDGIALVDARGRVVRCNRALGELLGRTVRPLETDWAPLVGWPHGYDTLPESLPLVRGDRALEVKSHPVAHEESAPGHRVGVVTDVTLRQRADDVRQRSAAVQDEARRAGREATRLKDEFLARVSQELRAPVNAILGWTHVLRTGEGDRETVRRAVDSIARNATLQARFVSDVFDFSRILSGKLHLDLQPVELAPVAESVFEELRAELRHKRMSVSAALDRGIRVDGDRDRLTQIVRNLVAAAVRRSEPGGRVEVELRVEDGRAALSVRHEGRGIAPEHLPQVLEPFAEAGREGGARGAAAGLELALARDLAERHGGALTASSPGVGRGSCFTLRLPLSAESGRRRERAAAASRAHLALDERLLEGVRVLAVDDSPDSRELATMVLRLHGAEVRTAESAEEGLQVVAAWQPHVILADIAMPGEDGYAFISRLRARTPEAGGRIPAVAWTGYAKDEDRLRTLQAGYQVHVSKPVATHELVWVVASLAGRT
jgi:CheY-like chemotaxis protein/signal transduction histidine kinase